MNIHPLLPTTHTAFCKSCGSADLTFCANVQWDEDSKKWVVVSIIDIGSECNSCGAEDNVEWKGSE